MALISDGGIFGFDIERAIRLEFATMHFMHVLEALAMDDLDEFLTGEGFALQSLAIDFGRHE